jgi:hypothetical protein
VANPSKTTDLLAFSAGGLKFLSPTRGLAEGPALKLVPPLRYVVEDNATIDGAVLTTCGTDVGCVAEAQRVLGERFVPPPPSWGGTGPASVQPQCVHLRSARARANGPARSGAGAVAAGGDRRGSDVGVGLGWVQATQVVLEELVTVSAARLTIYGQTTAILAASMRAMER